MFQSRVTESSGTHEADMSQGTMREGAEEDLREHKEQEA